MKRKILVLLDEYTDLNNQLINTVQCIDENSTALVWEDNAFLPENMMSVYEYYLQQQENIQHEVRDLFFAFLPVPEYWEIRAIGVEGAIINYGKKMATVYYRKPVEKRFVHRVEWNTEEGKVYKIDYYNKYGYVYCTAFINEDGQITVKSYYTAEHKEVLSLNYSNGVITLFDKGNIKRMYCSFEELKKDTLREIMDVSTHVFPTTDEHVKLIEEVQSGDNCKIVKSFLSKDNIIYAQRHYSKIKTGKEALILTSSDNLQGIECVAEELKHVIFHIGANTQVSDKLRMIGKKDNVYVYPQISDEKLQELYTKCDFYLDINAGREIKNAIVHSNAAGMLLMGYEFTLHDERYVLPEYILKDEIQMVNILGELSSDTELLDREVEKQHAMIAEAVRGMEEYL